jgi:hypothetical protein
MTEADKHQQYDEQLIGSGTGGINLEVGRGEGDRVGGGSGGEGGGTGGGGGEGDGEKGGVEG